LIKLRKWKEKNKIISMEGNTRWYSIEGTGDWVPSVTSILSVIDKGEHFLKWVASHASYDIACQVRDAAAERGTIVHDIAEDLMKGEEVLVKDYGPEVVKRVMCFEKWWKETNPEIIAIEEMLAYPGIRFAGRFDFIARINNKNVLIDIKTGGHYKSHDLQASCYKILWDTIMEQCGYGKEYYIDELRGLYLGDRWIKGPNPQYKQLKFLAKEVEGAVNLWYWMNSDGRGNPPRPFKKRKLPSSFKLKNQEKKKEMMDEPEQYL